MTSQLGQWFVHMVAIVMLAAAPVVAQEDDLEWPVELDTERGTIILYQPQVEAFDGTTLESRGAIAVERADGSPTIFGAIWFTSRVSTDLDSRTVTLDEVHVSASKFPDVDPDDVAALGTFLEAEIPRWELEISLDRLLATAAVGEGSVPSTAGLRDDPPEILYAEEPTVLVLIDGDPILSDLEGADLRFVANSAYYILKEPRSGRYYLKGGEHWYTAQALLGTWEVTTDLPAEVARAAQAIAEEEARQAAENPEPDEAAEEESEPAGESGPPAIVVRTHPAEMIQVAGRPEMVPVEGTTLLYVSNTETDILFDIASQRFYVLLAGRWFDSASLDDGDWKYTPPDQVPEGFAEIPADSDMAQVRFAVAGTQESREATLENQIPQTAEIDRATATVTVTYDGAPEFEQCTGEVAYALNTEKSVLRIDGRYYCCDEAVWFESATPDGPWDVATEVPPAVQDIPAECPVYNVRYCYIYESTPEVVYVAYTPGYTGSFVHHGCVVWGTGWWYHPWYRHSFYPRPVTWGFRVHWNPWTGWGFGFGFSNGWLHIGWGRPWVGGWWGPAGFRHGYRHGFHHGYRHGFHHGARAGFRAGVRAGNRASSRNMYARRSTGVRNTGRVGRGSPGATPGVRPRPSQRPNNVYADRNGNTFRNQGNDQWQRQDNRSGNWSQQQRAPDRVQRDSQARQRGNDRQRQSRPQTQPRSSRGGGGGGRRR